MRASRLLLVVASVAAAAPLLAAPSRGAAPAPHPSATPRAAPAASSSAALPPLPCRASAVKGGALRLRWRERATKMRECQNTAASSEHERDLSGDRLEGLLADGVRWKPGARVRGLEGSVRGWLATARELPLETIDVVVGYSGTKREPWGQALRFALVVSVKHEDNAMCHAWTAIERYRGHLLVRESDASLVSVSLTGSGQRLEATCQPGREGAKSQPRLCSTSALDLTIDRACAP